MQDEREKQFPRYYKHKGVFKNQELAVSKRNSKKYKTKEPEYLESKMKSDNYFSSMALNNKNKGRAKRHDYFEN